jgi:outer membrane protein
MAAGGAHSETLNDAIALAYQTNPLLLAARAQQRARDESYIQAKAALGPSAEVSAQEAFHTAKVDAPGTFFSPPSSAYDHATNASGQLVLRQPLYQQGQLGAALRAAHADVLAGREKLARAESDTLSQVIGAYADVLLARSLLALAQHNVMILLREQKETEAKVALKALTLTDGAQAAARLIAAQVQLKQFHRQVEDAEAKYLAVVGQSPGDLAPLPDLIGIPPYLGLALDAAARSNPDLLEAFYAEQASRERVAEAKAADGWQVGLTASLAQQPLEPYLPHEKYRDASAAIVVSRTLFSSGSHESKVRAAIETNNSDALNVSDTQRKVSLAVVGAWNDLASERAQIRDLRNQVIEERKAFNGAAIEARIGTRSTIEALNAEQELAGARLSLAQAYHDEYVARTALIEAMGLLHAELIDSSIVQYQPEASLRQRDSAYKVLPWEALVGKLDSVGASSSAAEMHRVGSLGDLPPTTGRAEAMPAAPEWTQLAPDLGLQPDGG